MVEVSCEAVWSWASVCWKISDYSFDFHACDGSANFLNFFPASILKSFTLLRISPFLPSCPFYSHIVDDTSLWSFVFLCRLLWFLHFHFKFVNLILLPFFLMSLSNRLSILFIFSKNQLLALLIFAMVSFVSFFIYFCPNFYDFFSFFWHWGSSFLSFLVDLVVELGYLFDFSLVSWGKLVLLWTVPLALFYWLP